MFGWVVAIGLVLALAALAWGWFEAGWLRRRIVEVELEGVAADLDGLRIAHLSDFHLGVPSRGKHAVEEAFAWVIEREPDLVCITGDLVSRRSGLPLLRALLERLPTGCFVVLGNHDLASSRDPFSQPVTPEEVAAIEGVTLLTDQSIEALIRGRRVQVVGVDPRTYAERTARPDMSIDESTDLRILLCHFPGIARRIPPVFHLALAGHLHAGQIVVPFPGGKLRLAHLRSRQVEGVYRYGSMILHISPGLGTTFVPFRFFARPEVTELVVRSA